jgi:transcriptional regulator with PAS, ATPase and Fis domain
MGPDSLQAFEQTMLKNMLDSNLTKTEIARKMQISRSTLYRKRKKHDLLS